jgi:two-component system sensor histidine kinase QseC
MKLVDKFTLWFVGIVAVVTPIFMLISFKSIKENIQSMEISRLEDVNNKVANQLRSGVAPHGNMLDRAIDIKKIRSVPVEKTKVSFHNFFNKELKRDECRLDVVSYYQIGQTAYSISTYNYIIQGEKILNGMIKALLWKITTIVLIVGMTGRLISRYILSSFHTTLDIIKGFSLRQLNYVTLPHTTTSEFVQLNTFVKRMTDNAIQDYSQVKEFSENASHEVQTPLAIIRTKIELLTETRIDEDQAALIADMQNAIDKLAKINRSLLLLTKLDNHEYLTKEKIEFCKITKEVLSSYESLIQLKNISVTTDFTKKLYLQIHPSLAEILLNNLISNAIRYNIEDGQISLTLNDHSLIITNTGLPPEFPTEQLFQRFKKSNQSAESIGLGLSIVKQICRINHFTVFYHYHDNIHTLEVNLSGNQSFMREDIDGNLTITEGETLLA